MLLLHNMQRRGCALLLLIRRTQCLYKAHIYELFTHLEAIRNESHDCCYFHLSINIDRLLREASPACWGGNCLKCFALQLSAANQLLEQTQQPYSYLVESVKQRDAQIRALKDTISLLEDSVRYLWRTQSHELNLLISPSSACSINPPPLLYFLMSDI